MLGDRLRIWEINTNPNVLASMDRADVERKAVTIQIAKQFAAAFAEIDVGDDSYPPEPPASLSS